MTEDKKEIWVFGDWRNYFQNRVTLQLIARARELAAALDAKVCAVVFGHKVDEWVWEYTCHGAEKIYYADHPKLKNYHVETFTYLMERLARERRPEIILIGGTSFGREFAPRLAKRLVTGLTADCIDLRIDEAGRLIQTAPSFGGNMLADIITPERRPQMATVRPGIFKELPHDDARESQKVRVPLPDDLPRERVRLVSAQRLTHREQKLETARVIVCGGRGVGGKKKFRRLHELALLLDGEVAATRPAVHAGWADHDALVGQAGKHIAPQLLLSFGVSGAIQHTAAIRRAGFIIAVNKNPNANMMKTADVAVVADANQFCIALIRELKSRIDKDICPE